MNLSYVLIGIGSAIIGGVLAALYAAVFKLLWEDWQSGDREAVVPAIVFFVVIVGIVFVVLGAALA